MTDAMVTIEQYQFLPEADAVRMHLQGEGITAMLVDAETVSTDWALGNAIGYIKLQVRESQMAAAQTIIEQLRARRTAREAQSNGSDANRCLACDAELQPDQTTCPHCGWSYANEDDETAERPDPVAAAEKSQSHEPISLLDSLRSLKRPLIILWFAPVIAGAIALAIFLLMTIADALTSTLRD